MNFGPQPQPLQHEPVEFFGGPMDGTVITIRPRDLAPVVYLRWQPGSEIPKAVPVDALQPTDQSAVYQLVRDATGWRYVHRPEGVPA